MALSDEPIDTLEALAKKHGALSYRNRADTQNPAFGFSVAGLAALLAESRRDALEEAAKVCDRGAEQMLHAYKREGAGRCAAAIRALKESPPPTA